VKKVLVAILIIVAVIVVASVAFLGTAGLFAKVQPKVAKTGAITFVYAPFVGPYAKTKGPMDKLYYGLLNEEKIETYKGIGIYFDNPANTPADQCRSIVGDVLEPGDLGKADALKAKGYRITELPAGERLSAEFPFANPLSIMLGIMKVYPAIAAAAKDSPSAQGAMVELYDVPAKKIRYLVLIPAETTAFLELMK
jgi:hypothetical protein